jgi:hypothetical protein
LHRTSRNFKHISQDKLEESLKYFKAALLVTFMMRAFCNIIVTSSAGLAPYNVAGK